MTTQRRAIIIATSLVVVAAIVLLTIHPWTNQAPAKQYQAGDTVTYTDAVTGATEHDLPGESVTQTSEVLVSPGATINGLDGLKSYLSNSQYLSVSGTLSSFLGAHSGESAVTAGIPQTVTQSNNKLTFTLAADRPQMKYTVTVDLTDSQSAAVTIGEAE